MITAQNPSTVVQDLFFFKAPSDGAYKASVLANSAWTEIPSDLICFQKTKDTFKADTVEECDLYVKTEIKAQDFAYIKVETVSADTNGATVKAPMADSEDTVIENENLRISFQQPADGETT